jgi:hypothetical protein
MKDNVLIQFAVLVLAVTAGQLLLKLGVSYLPDMSLTTPVKQVVASL